MESASHAMLLIVPAEDLQHCVPELLLLCATLENRRNRLQQIFEYREEGLQEASILGAVLQVGVSCELSDVTQVLYLRAEDCRT